MSEHSFPAIDDLVHRAERAAADQVRVVAKLIRLIADRGADPYLRIGALLEGAIHTPAKHVPPERQADPTEQLGQLLLERLRAHGLA